MGKIQPFKQIGKGLQFAAPFIPGVGGVAAGVGGSLLSGGLGGGGKKKKGGMPDIDPQLLAKLMGYADEGAKSILDTQGNVQRFRDTARADADRSSEGVGARLAQATGNPYLREAAKLDASNRATEAGNEFQKYAYSPEGQGSAYERALALYQPAIGYQTGQQQLSLQRQGIAAANRQPTIWETLLNTGGANLDTILELLKKKPGTQQGQQPAYLGWNTQQGQYA
jgi:hypothetical protein